MLVHFAGAGKVQVRKPVGKIYSFKIHSATNDFLGLVLEEEVSR